MRGWWMAALAIGIAAGAGAAAAPVSPVRVLKVETVTLRIRHRIFENFAETDTVRLKQDFQIGDTDYSARVVQFVPDFVIEGKDHRVASRSNEPRNPAVRVIVREKGVPQDTTWAFLNFAPHFRRNSMLSFQIMRIDFEGRPPVVAKDTTATAAPAAKP